MAGKSPLIIATYIHTLLLEYGSLGNVLMVPTIITIQERRLKILIRKFRTVRFIPFMNKSK